MTEDIMYGTVIDSARCVSSRPTSSTSRYGQPDTVQTVSAGQDIEVDSRDDSEARDHDYATIAFELGARKPKEESRLRDP